MTKKVETHSFVIETMFVVLLVVASLGMYVHHKFSAPPTYETASVALATNDTDRVKTLYNQFWQAFNTNAIVSATNDGVPITSPSEVEIYRQRFLSDLNLSMDKNGIYVLDNTGGIVLPSTLNCYLQQYMDGNSLTECVKQKDNTNELTARRYDPNPQ